MHDITQPVVSVTQHACAVTGVRNGLFHRFLCLKMFAPLKRISFGLIIVFALMTHD